jgi:hypothetical protein
MVLNKTEGSLIITDHIGTQALTLTFLAIILLPQEITAAAKGFHHQTPVLHFGKEII